MVKWWRVLGLASLLTSLWAVTSSTRAESFTSLGAPRDQCTPAAIYASLDHSQKSRVLWVKCDYDVAVAAVWVYPGPVTIEITYVATWNNATRRWKGADRGALCHRDSFPAALYHLGCESN
jgi:hypothetical protein